MVKRLFLVVVLVLAVFSGYALGQRNPVPVPSNPLGPVFSGGELGFQSDMPLNDIIDSGASSITGRFVVKVNGRWVDARPSMRHGLVPAK
jgi:hypothetical protein